MSLNAELAEVRENFYVNAPKSIVDPIKESLSSVKAAYDPSSWRLFFLDLDIRVGKKGLKLIIVSGTAIQVGATLPEFTLTDALGKAISSKTLLANGPILINFYRGEWCPFCNLQLSSLQKHLAGFEAKGVTLVAITPELPTETLTTTEKRGLKFAVLSDTGNMYARKLGIVWKMPETLRPVFKTLGNDLIKSNGDDSFELPIPASLLVDGKGVVRKTFVEPDFTQRLEPKTALEWVATL
jgi:peroxiredoxin